MSEAPAMPGAAGVLVILPCFNEAGSIAGVLREIQAVGYNLHTLVVDDGSLDATYQVASELSPTVRLAENLGIGGAVHTAIRYASELGYEFCVQVDGDGQHPPDQVAVLLQAYQAEPANIIIGSRYLQGGGFRSTLARRIGSRIIGLALRVLFGQRVTDPTSGLRLFDRRAMRFFETNYPHDFPEPISLARALWRGLTVREVAVTMRERQHGASSIKPLIYMIRVLGYILLLRLGPRG